MRRFVIALVASALAVSVSSAQVVIDTFSNTQTNILRTTVGNTPVLQTDASAAGGFRNVTNFYNSGSGNYDLIFNGSVMQSTADAGVLGSFLVQYGTQAQLNINASATNAFQFERVFLDLSSGFTAIITSGNGAVVATFTSSATAIPGGGAPSQLITVPFSSFANGGLLNLADIDFVSLRFDAAQQATQFQLDNIRLVNISVPEPASIAMIGLTGAAVACGWYVRRRRNQKDLNTSFTRI